MPGATVVRPPSPELALKQQQAAVAAQKGSLPAKKFEAPKFEAPKFEAPKFEAPELPKFELPF